MLKIFGRKIFGNTVFFKGCMISHICPELAENYRKVLDFLGIDFIELPREPCCGMPLLNAGFTRAHEKQVQRLNETLKEFEARRILCACPACYHQLKEVAKESEVELILRLIAAAIREGGLKLRRMGEGIRVTYHDPCHLGRYCGVYDEPRNIIRSMGFELVEMEFSRENSICCGAGAGVKSNYKVLADAIGRERIKQASATGASILLTACPLCYMHLKENSGGIEVREFSELLVEGLLK